MQIKSAGREFATWTITASEPVTALEVSFDAGATWIAMTTIDATTFQILVAGPDADSNPIGTVVLALGLNFAQIRVIDNPEIIIRDAGTINVV